VISADYFWAATTAMAMASACEFDYYTIHPLNSYGREKIFGFYFFHLSLIQWTRGTPEGSSTHS